VLCEALGELAPSLSPEVAEEESRRVADRLRLAPYAAIDDLVATWVRLEAASPAGTVHARGYRYFELFSLPLVVDDEKHRMMARTALLAGFSHIVGLDRKGDVAAVFAWLVRRVGGSLDKQSTAAPGPAAPGAPPPKG
jgi:hypothetical protein